MLNQRKVMAASPGAKWLRAVGALLLAASAALGQPFLSVTDGTTPSALAPGSLASSYPLNRFEHYSPYTGKVSFNFPLHHVGGRGAAAFDITLHLGQQWTAEKVLVPNPPM